MSVVFLVNKVFIFKFRNRQRRAGPQPFPALSRLPSPAKDSLSVLILTRGIRFVQMFSSSSEGGHPSLLHHLPSLHFLHHSLPQILLPSLPFLHHSLPRIILHSLARILTSIDLYHSFHLLLLHLLHLLCRFRSQIRRRS